MLKLIIKYEICVCLAMAFAVSVPLLVADPIGARCFYVSYVFQVLAWAKIVKYLFEDSVIDLYYGVLGLASIVLIISVIYTRMFYSVGIGNQTRSDIIDKAIEEGQSEIVLPILPHNEFCWTTIPGNDLWKRRFKEFYHINQDTTLKFE